MADKIIRVFLASPSGLDEEREIANQVIDRINKTNGREFDILLDLYMWEDVQPTFSRPQGQINRYLEECDLFVGILWNWWGSPSGRYESGFEEEFEVAVELRTIGVLEDIVLFFKKVEPASLKDPGKQLEKVLKFKERISQSKEALYKEFDDSYDWKDKIRECISIVSTPKK